MTGGDRGSYNSCSKIDYANPGTRGVHTCPESESAFGCGVSFRGKCTRSGCTEKGNIKSRTIYPPNADPALTIHPLDYELPHETLLDCRGRNEANGHTHPLQKEQRKSSKRTDLMCAQCKGPINPQLSDWFKCSQNCAHYECFVCAQAAKHKIFLEMVIIFGCRVKVTSVKIEPDDTPGAKPSDFKLVPYEETFEREDQSEDCTTFELGMDAIKYAQVLFVLYPLLRQSPAKEPPATKGGGCIVM